MPIKIGFPYPKEEYVKVIKEFHAEINGVEFLEPIKEWHTDKWYAQVHCSRGIVLEKAGFSFLHLIGGKINENPRNISLFETLAYPVNPKIPEFII